MKRKSKRRKLIKRKRNTYKKYQTKLKGGSNRIINLYNSFHLGDNIFTLIYLCNLKDTIINNNITINFYILKENIDSVKDFICFDNIHLHDINTKPSDAIDTWIGSQEYEHNYYKYVYPPNKEPLDIFLPLFFTEVGKKINLPGITEFKYTDEDLLNRYNSFNDNYKDIDFLIINGNTVSGQFMMDKLQWDNFIQNLSAKYKIVTTEKLNNIISTRDYNLSLKDIAAISTHAKYIIAVNTGPIVGCFNSYTLNNVKKMFVYDGTLGYSNPKIIMNLPLDKIVEQL
jgi:hypothetical protein